MNFITYRSLTVDLEVVFKMSPVEFTIDVKKLPISAHISTLSCVQRSIYSTFHFRDSTRLQLNRWKLPVVQGTFERAIHEFVKIMEKVI